MIDIEKYQYRFDYIANETDYKIANVIKNSLVNFSNRPYLSGNTIKSIRVKIGKNGYAVVIEPKYYDFKALRRTKKITTWKYPTGKITKTGKIERRSSRWSYAYKVNYITGGFSKKRLHWVENCIEDEYAEIKRIAENTDFSKGVI